MIVVYASNVWPNVFLDPRDPRIFHFTTPTACVWIVPGTIESSAHR